MSSAFSKSSVFVCPHARTRENSVSKKFHSGAHIRKVPFALIVVIGYVWTEVVSVKTKLRFQMKTDACGQGLKIKACISVSARSLLSF